MSAQARPASGNGWFNLAKVLAFDAMLGMLRFTWWIDQLGARRLRKRIDELDALMGGNE